MATYKINDYINELLTEQPIGTKRRPERGGLSQPDRSNTNTQNVGNVQGGNITTSGGNINASQRMGDQHVTVVAGRGGGGGGSSGSSEPSRQFL